MRVGGMETHTPTVTVDDGGRARRGLRLVVVGPDGTKSECELLPDVEVTVGRGREAEHTVPYEGVSRRHAHFVLRGGKVWVEDCGSKNGTYVRRNRLRPGEAVQISPGDLVELGSVVLVALQGEVAGEAVSRRDVPASMEAVLGLVKRLAPAEITVLLQGETGVGKGRVAELLHQYSGREGRFVAINCGALASSLLESELFGHEKGAFTGAIRERTGHVEAANQGTLFLDEVGELSTSAQVRLLRVVEEKELVPVGGVVPRPVTARVVAATNRDLGHEADAGRFRIDLYYRLAAFVVSIPPLRDRRREIEPLAQQFVKEACERAGPPVATLSPQSLSLLRAYAWPGNIRELRNMMERAVVLCTGGLIEPSHLPLARQGDEPEIEPAHPAPPSESPPIREDPADLELSQIVDALERAAGNQSHAAELLGIHRKTLARLMDRYGLARQGHGGRPPKRT